MRYMRRYVVGVLAFGGSMQVGDLVKYIRPYSDSKVGIIVGHADNRTWGKNKVYKVLWSGNVVQDVHNYNLEAVCK